MTRRKWFGLAPLAAIFAAFTTTVPKPLRVVIRADMSGVTAELVRVMEELKTLNRHHIPSLVEIERNTRPPSGNGWT